MTAGKDARGPSHGKASGAKKETEGLPIEERVLRVHHLDAVRIDVQADYRFKCELRKPVSELRPREARDLLKCLEPVIAALRLRAGDES